MIKSVLVLSLLLCACGDNENYITDDIIYILDTDGEVVTTYYDVKNVSTSRGHIKVRYKVDGKPVLDYIKLPAGHTVTGPLGLNRKR